MDGGGWQLADISRTIYEMIGVEGTLGQEWSMFSISDEDQRMKADPCGTWAPYVL